VTASFCGSVPADCAAAARAEAVGPCAEAEGPACAGPDCADNVPTVHRSALRIRSEGDLALPGFPGEADHVPEVRVAILVTGFEKYFLLKMLISSRRTWARYNREPNRKSFIRPRFSYDV